ncbi:MAG: hypothetical protein REI11_19115 [Patulibacter sp.]|nr:hypothetical protein [Patulibacter sp.]
MERTDRVRIEGYDTSTPITVGEATVLHVVRLAPPPEAVATRDAYATYALRIREGE